MQKGQQGNASELLKQALGSAADQQYKIDVADNSFFFVKLLRYQHE
jgi:hypothetical protein